MKRATVDTNIFISALFWHGVPEQVIKAFEAGTASLILSDDILTELERKLRHKKFVGELAEIGLLVDEIVNSIRMMAEIVLPADVPEDAIRDPKDRIILACAVGGRADVIVSGDKDLTQMGSYQAIPILRPAQFLQLVNDTPSDQP